MLLTFLARGGSRLPGAASPVWTYCEVIRRSRLGGNEYLTGLLEKITTEQRITGLLGGASVCQYREDPPKRERRARMVLATLRLSVKLGSAAEEMAPQATIKTNGSKMRIPKVERVTIRPVEVPLLRASMLRIIRPRVNATNVARAAGYPLGSGAPR